MHLDHGCHLPGSVLAVRYTLAIKDEHSTVVYRPYLIPWLLGRISKLKRHAWSQIRRRRFTALLVWLPSSNNSSLGCNWPVAIWGYKLMSVCNLHHMV